MLPPPGALDRSFRSRDSLKRLSTAKSGDPLLEREFGAKALKIVMNKGFGELSSAPPISDDAVPRFERALYLGFVPFLSVADIGEAEVVLLGPEKRHVVEAFARAEKCCAPPSGLDARLKLDPTALRYANLVLRGGTTQDAGGITGQRIPISPCGNANDV